MHEIALKTDEPIYVKQFKIPDITHDILSLKPTRAFWHQNTFTFNKPAALGAKIL
jgi:hypothetical protein